jgi:ABC-type taurine transport system ATPase subunit
MKDLPCEGLLLFDGDRNGDFVNTDLSSSCIRNLNAILLGPPGSGKGTQARLLVERHGFTHLSTGDILREEVRNDSPLGKVAVDFMRKGLLVPDEYIAEMVKKNSAC